MTATPAATTALPVVSIALSISMEDLPAGPLARVRPRQCSPRTGRGGGAGGGYAQAVEMTDPPLTELLPRLPLFSGLTRQQLEIIRAGSFPVSLERGEILFHQGDPVRG